jgi:hypothetical protein
MPRRKDITQIIFYVHHSVFDKDHHLQTSLSFRNLQSFSPVPSAAAVVVAAVSAQTPSFPSHEVIVADTT